MASTHPTEGAIRTSWSWFLGVAADLGGDLESPAILEELSRRVSGLGEVSWELGPGLVAKCALVITPDGRKGILATTERIVALAPEIPGWEFHSARPPRAWRFEFSIETDAGKVHVDARHWRYVLLRFPDRMFDVVVEPGDLDGVSDDDRYVAATVLLDGVLGERRRLEWIVGIEPVATSSEDLRSRASPVQVFAEHLESLIRSP